MLVFLLIVGGGWFITSTSANNEGLLSAKRSRITQISDIEKLMVTRAGLNHVSEFQDLTPEETEAAALQVCALRDSVSETNFTRHLRSMGVPYDVRRVADSEKGITAFVDERCEVFVAKTSILSAELSKLEGPVQ